MSIAKRRHGQQLLRNPFARVLFLAIGVVLFILKLRPKGVHLNEVTQHFENLQSLPVELQIVLAEQQTIPAEEQTIPTQQQTIPAKTFDQSLVTLPDCSMDSSRLQYLQKQYNLSDEIEYGQRYINTRMEDVPRKSLTKVDGQLFPELPFEVVDLANPQPASTCWKPFEITVTKSEFPKTVNASDVLFGISTTYARLYDPETSPMKEWAHWLTDGEKNSNGGGLILRLLDASDEQIEIAQQELTSMGIDVQVYHSDSSIVMAERYLSLIPKLYQSALLTPRKWLVLSDDDTFFPSMHSLLARLSTYPHEDDMYIGTFSEDVNNIARHGSQAFGGAGVFLSLSLAQQITQNYDSCVTQEKINESDTGWGPQGDILLRKCIYENTDTRLRMLKDLHQLDIQGDPSGFYESGLLPLSVHHFKGGIWHRARPYQGAQVIKACGDQCFMQRFLTEDGFMINNGYSVVHYPRGLQGVDMEQMERTFHPAPDDHGWNLDFMMGPGRRSLVGTGRKIAWELRESIVGDDGIVRQTYIRLARDRRWTENGSPIFRLDGVLELVWVPEGSEASMRAGRTELN